MADGRWKNLVFGLGLFALVHISYFSHLKIDLGAERAFYSYWFLAAFFLTVIYSDTFLKDFFSSHYNKFKWFCNVAFVIGLVHIYSHFFSTHEAIYSGGDPYTTAVLDQGSYYQILKAIVEGTFSDEKYWYGVGYPLLGALFYPLYPKDPLMVVNLIALLVVILFNYKILRLLFLERTPALLAAYFLGFNKFTVAYIALPWTSTVSLTFYAVAVYFVLEKKLSLAKLIFIGFATGITFAARYVDVVLYIPLWIYLFFSAKNLKDKVALQQFGAGALVATIMIGLVMLSHKIYLGGFFETPYRYHKRYEGGTDQSIETYLLRVGLPFVQHLYGTFVDSKSTAWDYYTAGPHWLVPIFGKNLIYFFSLPGLFLLFRDFKNYRKEFSVLFSGLVLFLIIYGHHPGSCPGCLQFKSDHYFKPFIPWLFSGGLYFFYSLFTGKRKWRVYLGGVIVMVSIFAPITYLMKKSVPHHVRVAVEKNQMDPDETINYQILLLNKFDQPIAVQIANTYTPLIVLKGRQFDGELYTSMLYKLEKDPQKPWIWLGFLAAGINPSVCEWYIQAMNSDQAVVKVSNKQQRKCLTPSANTDTKPQ